MASIIIILGIFLMYLNEVVLENSSAETDNNNPTFYNIGGVLSTNDSEAHFSTTIAVSKVALSLTS